MRVNTRYITPPKVHPQVGCPCRDVFLALITALVCGFYRSTPGLILFQTVTQNTVPTAWNQGYENVPPAKPAVGSNVSHASPAASSLFEWAACT